LQYRENALKGLLKYVGKYYNASEEEIEEEFQDLLKTNSLKDCLICYQKIAWELGKKCTTY